MLQDLFESYSYPLYYNILYSYYTSYLGVTATPSLASGYCPQVLSIATGPEKGWLTSVWGLRPMRHVSVKALLDKNSLTSVRGLRPMRPDWRQCRSSAQ